jgi:pantoate--beta-alanine ligase
MELIHDPDAMQAWAEAARIAGRRIALVPTMGALHDGHLALVRRANELADRVAVSIFVNPMQFDQRADFEAYPSELAADAEQLAPVGVAALFVPNAAAMYPEGFQTHVDVAGVTAGLCGARRPGHFRGVATVVTKLFHLVRPQVAVFGEKDYQQLVTVRRLVRDLNFGIEIVGVPTVREPDGLAMSSRNRRLSVADRAAARCVPRALRAAIDAVAHGERTAVRVVAAVETEIAREPQARLEYAELRDAETLAELPVLDRPARLIVAVWIGGVRLIDNCPLASVATAMATGNGSHRRPAEDLDIGAARGEVEGRERVGAECDAAPSTGGSWR